MTGYGKGEYAENGLELTCEIKTVNNRYLDVSIKAPRVFAAYEDVIRTTIRKKLTRGHADLFISFKDKRERPTALTVDTALALSYVAAAKALQGCRISLVLPTVCYSRAGIFPRQQPPRPGRWSFPASTSPRGWSSAS